MFTFIILIFSQTASYSNDNPDFRTPAGTFQVNNNIKQSLIGPWDVLSIAVWRHPDLSKDITVNEAGTINFPFAGELNVLGLTTKSVMEILETKLGRIIRDPIVSVNIKKVVSKKIFVLGQVLRPGVYEYQPNMTVLEAITYSGGYTDKAVLRSVVVIRSLPGSDQADVFKLDIKATIEQGNIKENILISPGDYIFVPKSFISDIGTFIKHFFTNTHPALRYYLDVTDPDNR